MDRRVFCRIFPKYNSFLSVLTLACLLAVALGNCFAFANSETSDISKYEQSLTAVYAMGGYSVDLNNAEYIENGRDDGKMLTDRTYVSVKSANEQTEGWVKFAAKDATLPFSATVDIDFGFTADDVSRFYLRTFKGVDHKAEIPTGITFYYSADGKNFEKAGKPTTGTDTTTEKCAAVYGITLDKSVPVRYLRVIIEGKGKNAIWINEIGAYAMSHLEYAQKTKNGTITDRNGIIYTVNDGIAAVSGFDPTPVNTVATPSNADFNSDENGYVLGVGTGNAVKVITDFIGEGRINYSNVPNNIKYIIIHNTGTTEEETDAARYNRRVHNNTEEISWHYTVDENLIYHSLADSVVGWHAGSGMNYESIGIEICVNGAPKRSNGKLVFEGKEYEKWVEERFDRSLRNTAVLVAELLTRYRLSKDAVIQHYDSSDKNCPEWMRYKDGKFVYNGTLWERFMGYVDEYYGMMNTNVSNGTAVYKTEIVVPDYISYGGDIYPVREISALAFSDIEAPIRKITVGKNVKDIALGCFDGNVELEIVEAKDGNADFFIDEKGRFLTVDGKTVFDPSANTDVLPEPKESCTLDIREINGRYYIFFDDERYTLSQLADNYGAYEFTAHSIDGKLILLDEIPGTGAVLSFNGARLYVVIPGDINGDALLDTRDYVLIRRTCLKTYSPLQRQVPAMLLSGRSEVTAYDYIVLKRHILGTYSIFGKS